MNLAGEAEGETRDPIAIDCGEIGRDIFTGGNGRAAPATESTLCELRGES